MLIKVRFGDTNNGDGLSVREYTYRSEAPLAVGDHITVPVRDTSTDAWVSAIDVPESEIAAFRDKVKTIPAGSQITKPIAVSEPGPELEPEPESPHLPEPQPPTPPQQQMPPERRDIMAVDIHPELTYPYQRLVAEVDAVLVAAISRTVASADELIAANNDLNLISGLRRAVDAKKSIFTTPLMAILGDIRAAFVKLEEPLSQAWDITRQKVKDFNAVQEANAREAERINALRMEAAQAEMKLKGELTESVNLVPETPPITRVTTDVGTTGQTTITRWEVTDFLQVPDDYKLVDAAKIGKVVRGSKGTITIPGIRIWQEKNIAVRPR